MDQLKSRVIAVILGVVFVWLSVRITGFGAAIAVPTELFRPLAQQLDLFAITLLDLVRIDIPLVVAFLLFILLSKLVVKKPDPVFYLLLLLPFFVFQLYMLLQFPLPLSHLLVMVLPRTLFFVACCYFVVRAMKPGRAL